MAAAASVPLLAFHVDASEIDASCRRLVQRLKPRWPTGDVTLQRLTAGITNVIVKCSCKSSGDAPFLVRIYGKNTELLINRERELANHTLLFSLGLAPAVLGRFDNGYAYEFAPGKSCSPAQVSDPKISSIIARNMGTLHRKAPVSDSEASLFPTLREWMEKTPVKFSKAGHQASFDANFSFAELRDAIRDLERLLIPLRSPVVFCHNDLLCENIILDPATNGVSFIDYEYGKPNFRGFDIGNHFNEYAGMGDATDYGLYPGAGQQRAWLRCYTAAYRDVRDEAVTEDELAGLLDEVNKFALASHLFWTLWALVQAEHSQIDFDYMGYAVIRFREYRRRCQQPGHSHL